MSLLPSKALTSHCNCFKRVAANTAQRALLPQAPVQAADRDVAPGRSVAVQKQLFAQQRWNFWVGRPLLGFAVESSPQRQGLPNSTARRSGFLPSSATLSTEAQAEDSSKPSTLASAEEAGALSSVNPRKSTRRMANSKYEYVKKYELDDTLLPGCWIVVRIDGRGFTKFSDLHGFEKPNDKRALDLMDECAKEVLREFPDVRIAYGESDEYSFVLAKGAELYGRRSSKIVSLITSCFTANHVPLWPQLLPDTPLQATPMFDGRAVLYPDDKTLRDYLSWRQADTHINNQYNTCFWALVKKGSCTPAEAQATLKGSDAEFKNNLLFTRFGINYNTLPEQYKKGSVVMRLKQRVVVKMTAEGQPVERERTAPVVLHCDIIRDTFWNEHPHLLAP